MSNEWRARLLVGALVAGAFAFGVEFQRQRHRCPERPVAAEDFRR